MTDPGKPNWTDDHVGSVDDAQDRARTDEAVLRRLLSGLSDLRDGNFRRRLVFSEPGLPAQVAAVFNELAERDQYLVNELRRVSGAAGNGEWPIAPIEFGESVEGGWSVAAGAVNGMLHSVLAPLDELNRVLTALTRGDLSQRMPRRADDVALPGEFGHLGAGVNALLDQLSLLCKEVSRVATDFGRDGHFDGRIQVPGLVGSWRELADSVDGMATGITTHLREISQVVRAVDAGDLNRRMNSDAAGEMAELRDHVNSMVDGLARFTSEMSRVTREVSTEGKLGGQAYVPEASGTWREATDAVNAMSRQVTSQVRNLSRVITAVAAGDLTQRVDVDARGEVLGLKETFNAMIDQLAAVTDEIVRLTRELGVEGKLGGQARVHGLAGTWRELTDNVNTMADTLTGQMRSIVGVATAVAGGDLSKKSTVTAKGEVATLVETINAMVDTLSVFAEQVTQVAREVGTEGTLGGQARVPNVAGTWKDLTDNVNIMARNLTNQVRNIAQVTTAVARGDLSRRIDVDARGEILELKTTINTMVGQLSAFASEVTRVAREVGSEGKLGGQAEVADVSGTWRRLTESVNRLAGNLTTQVRAIATVATAVTNGDLTQRITVQASGEVAELKDNLNEMIANLRESTRANQEQDWLKGNFARLSAVLKGQQDVGTLARLILGELSPLVGAHYGVFYIGGSDAHGTPVWTEVASYGTPAERAPASFHTGESLVGQVVADHRTIVVNDAPGSYLHISSGLGAAAASHIVIMPVLFENEVLGVLELASFSEFSQPHLDLFEQLKETIGVDLNTIIVNSRTESLLSESQHLATELRERSEQLQRQQSELRRSNAELEEKATLLSSRNWDIELKNREIEQARQELEERARQLSEASAYKSEFLANMSHELRTPLNSVLLLAKLLTDNTEGNLSAEQVELASTIHQAGTDLLALINDVLDLSKVEAGRMRLLVDDVTFEELATHLESLYRPLAEDKGLRFGVVVSSSLPSTFRTDHNRLEQVVRNLLSNAIKFTESGSVELRVRPADSTEVTTTELRSAPQCIAFSVQDSGIGIPEEQNEVVFLAFQQVDGTTVRKYDGTGLGLSISQELAKLLGGELQVQSTPGQGSTFTLFVPSEPGPDLEPESTGEPDGAANTGAANTGAGNTGAANTGAASTGAEVDSSASTGSVGAPDSATTRDAPAEGIDPPETAPRQRSATTAGSTSFADDKVLIVDDDSRGTHALATLLEENGLCVVRADTAIAGLGTLQRQHDVRAVLMDVMMPEMDGNTAIRLIREMPRYRDLAIIVVTAQALPGDRQRSIEAGADECVTKPVDPERLLALLATYMDLSGRAGSSAPQEPDPADYHGNGADGG